MKEKIEAMFFATQDDFRTWLKQYGTSEKELIVGYFKVGSGKPSMTWSESVDQALCFGWIDGVRRTIDAERYCIRFTPRKPKSNWSTVNVEKITVLKEKGLMTPAGLALFEQRELSKSGIYAYEQPHMAFSAEYEAQMKAHPKAWKWFNAMPMSYKNPAINWVMTAKQPATQQKRLNELIADSEAGRKIKRYSY